MYAGFAGNQHKSAPRQVDACADAKPLALRRLLGDALNDERVAAFQLYALFKRQKGIQLLPDFHKRRVDGRTNSLNPAVIQRFRLAIRLAAFHMQLNQFAILQHRRAHAAGFAIYNQFSFHRLQIN